MRLVALVGRNRVQCPSFALMLAFNCQGPALGAGHVEACKLHNRHQHSLIERMRQQRGSGRALHLCVKALLRFQPALLKLQTVPFSHP